MFTSVGRRLALLNAVMVIAIIALVGVGTADILRVELDREETRLLQRRAESAAGAWVSQRETSTPAASLFLTTSDGPTPPVTGSGDDDDGDEEDDHEREEDERESRDALTGGDVVLFGVNSAGELIVNDRGFTFPGLPDQASIAAALSGRHDERQVDVNGEPVRLYTVPVVNAEGVIVGAVQAARGQNLYQQQRSTVLWASVAGIVLGVILAPLAGLFLARRAMRPINAAFAAQRAFVADASHELRTPLTVIRANAELLTRMPDASPDEIETESGQIIARIDEMTRLVNDLLFLARADEGAPGLLERRDIDLADIVRDETALHQPRAIGARLTLTTETMAEPVIAGDASRLRQVVRILIDNALAYTPAGGTIRVTLDIAAREPVAVLSVRDTGIGIPHAEQAHIFDRFYRSDPARARQTGGAGLGLAIARTIVEAHGGSISLDSEPGAGATFTIRLPLSEPVAR
jgi:signal transduction histidine kinase